MTNTTGLDMPTLDRQVMYGTSPLAFAAPTVAEGPFVLGMSTTLVSQVKIEL